MRKRNIVAVLSTVFIALACGGLSGLNPGEDSETHFLALCEDDCGEGLSCICGVCTVTCNPARSCSDLDAKAICRAPDGAGPSLTCHADSQPSICDVTCDTDAECRSLSEEHTCLNGSCRRATCLRDGRGYAAGQSFAADDGCNTCTCSESGDVACTDRACAPSDSCVYGGATYSPGDTFPSSDGCNTCSCSESGEVACTDRACAPSGTCVYDGATYSPGDMFPSSDGCNTCSCSESGEVACTRRDCGPAGTCEYDGTTYSTGDAFPSSDGCNNCFCSESGSVTCTQRDCVAIGTCEYDGVTYSAGDTFLSSDGCNSCSCSEDGEVICTEEGCDPCSLPFDVGPCDAAIPVFWHNPETGVCEPQTYGGCEGNANRFETREACETECGDSGPFAACEVDGTTYPHGAQNIPDFQSCNTCSCHDGVVGGCTKIHCPKTCPSGEGFGTECARCAPDDACEVVRSGCLKQCASDADCSGLGGLCIDALCRNLCG